MSGPILSAATSSFYPACMTQSRRPRALSPSQIARLEAEAARAEALALQFRDAPARDWRHRAANKAAFNLYSERARKLRAKIPRPLEDLQGHYW